MNKKKFSSKDIALTGILTAIAIVLQLLSNIIPTTVNINLSLIPIVLGALLLGPIAGAFLGLVNGVIILLSPNTVSVFIAISPFGTILTCLTKTTVAGLVAGFIAKGLRNKNDVLASVLASIVVPVINTGMFIIYTIIFFKEGLGLPTIGSILTAFIGINFIFEIVSTLILGPSLYKIAGHIGPHSHTK